MASVIRSAPISRIPIRHPMKPSEIERTTSAPTRLQRLQAQFQQKILQDKEDALLGRLRASQQNALLRVAARNGVVRNYFSERRQTSNAWGYNTGPPDLSKTRASPGAAAKPPIAHRQHSGGVGRDRAKPLQPISRCVSDGHEAKANSMNKVRALEKIQHDPQPPSKQKPSYVRSLPRAGSGGSSKPPQAPAEKMTDFQKWQLEQDKARSERLAKFQQHNVLTENQQVFNHQDNKNDSRNSPVKKNSYHQWKAEMNKKNSRHNQNDQFGTTEPKPDAFPRKAKVHKPPKKIEAKPPVQHIDQIGESLSARCSPDSPMASQRSKVEDDLMERKQNELLMMIEKQRSELAKLQHQRVDDEKQAAEEAAEERRRELAQRERNRRLKEAEELKMKREAEAAAFQAQDDVYSPQKSNRSVARSPVSSRRQMSKTPHSTAAGGQGLEEQYASPKSNRTVTQSPVSSRKLMNRTPQKNKKPAHSPPPDNVFPKGPKKFVPMKQRKPPPSPPPADEYPRDNNVNFYAQAAQDDGAMEAVTLKECSMCGRRFAEERLAKHTNVCAKAGQKKRKVFDPVKMRTAGTEQAQFVSRIKEEPAAPKKKGNWKAKHEEFIRNIRYAKKVTEMEANGGDLSSLPPPPPSENPDYKQCPHCGRRFNPSAAERHIPRCQSLKTKPLNTRRR